MLSFPQKVDVPTMFHRLIVERVDIQAADSTSNNYLTKFNVPDLSQSIVSELFPCYDRK
jgi:hypothetical protein